METSTLISKDDPEQRDMNGRIGVSVVSQGRAVLEVVSKVLGAIENPMKLEMPAM